MHQRAHHRAFTVLAACGAAFSISGRAEGQVYTWNGPYSGTSNLFSAANWIGGLPTGGPTTELRFTNFDGNSYSASNNLGGPLSVNRIFIRSYTTGSMTVKSEAGNFLRLTGAAPTIALDGPTNATVGSAAAGTFYGLDLAPTSGSTTINGSGTGLLTLGGATSGISGFGGLDISLGSPTGIVSIFSPTAASGFANSFTGGVRLNSGRLQLSASNALGNNVLTVNGGALSSSGAIVAANDVVLNSNLVFEVGSALTLNGQISGSGGLFLRNSAFFSGQNLTLTNSNTYTGSTVIDNAPIRTAGANLATLNLTNTCSLATQSLTIGRGGTLALTGNSNNTRVGDNVAVAMNGGNISMAGTAGAGSLLAEKFGDLTASGNNTFTLTAGAANNILSFGTLTRVDNAGITLRGAFRGFTQSGSTGSVTFASPLATISDPLGPVGGSNFGVVAYAAGDPTNAGNAGTNFVTYDAGGLRIISSTQDPSVVQIAAGGTFDAASANRNVNMSAATIAVNGAQRVNALSDSGGATLTGTGTLTVFSGALISGGGGIRAITFSGPTLDFGDNTGYIHLGSSVNVSNGSSIKGTNGVVVVGADAGAVPSPTSPAVLNLNATSAANTFTGGLFVNGGTVNFVRDDQLGATGGEVVLSGGSLGFAASGSNTVTITRPVRLGAGGGNIVATSGNTINIASDITGTGDLTINPNTVTTGVTRLSGNNSYSGRTFVYANGTLSIGSDSNLGQGDIVLAGGTLQFNTSGVISKNITYYNSGSPLDTNGNNVTLSGRFSGTAPGGSGLNKVGAGVLTLTGDNTDLGGQALVAAGTLALAGNGRLPNLSNLTVSSGAEFRLDNSAGANLSNRIADLTRITLAGGGTVRFVGNASAASSQVFGGLNLNAAGNAGIVVDGFAGQSATLTSAGLITGVGALVKSGSGAFQITGNANNYSGGTMVSGGLLLVNNTAGSATGTGALDVLVGGALGGNGVVGPSAGNGVTIYGLLAPGNSIGTISLAANVALYGTLGQEISGAAGDLTVITGNLTLGNASQLALSNSNSYINGNTYTIVTYSGTLTGTFGSITGLDPALYSISYGSGSSSAITITFIPAPGALALLLPAAGALVAPRRRR